MGRASTDRDWEGYYRANLGRAPRPLLAPALAAAGAPLPAHAAPQAIDLGCGDGTESLALLAAGWRVLALDQQPAALAWVRARVPPAHADRLTTQQSAFHRATLPPAALIFAYASLPFSPPALFGEAWARVRAALAPGGVLAVQLFGARDDWAPAGRDPQTDMSVHTRPAVEALLEGLTLVQLDEHEEAGRSYLGPKQWHFYDIVARRPR